MGRDIDAELSPSKVCKKEANAALKAPRKYKVLLLNDAYTPMEFVVEVLKYFFHKGENEATNIMWEVHTSGQAVCGIYPRDIAETKVEMVLAYASLNEHPLLCVMEKA